MLLTGGCAATPRGEREAIAVSFEPLAWMAGQIAGDDLDIITLLPAGSDPEVYQPTVATMRRLADADAWFSLGSDGFEQALNENISQNFPSLKIIDSTEGIDKICGGHGDAEHEHGLDDLGGRHRHEHSFDPHVLASVRNCAVMAETIGRSLSQLYPERREKYLTAAKKLSAKLKALDDSISRLDLEEKAIAIRHPSLSYFARDYGVVQIALSDIGKETSPLQMKQRIDATYASRPAVMIVEKEHASGSDGDTARQLATDTIQVSLNSANWLNDLKRISHEIDRD